MRPTFGRADSPALWPSERAERIALSQLDARFALYRNALNLDPGLGFHSFRRSYVTHLIEAGWDPFFVQQQVGHDARPPANEPGPWRTWPWSLAALVPEAAHAANHDTPALVVWHFQLPETVR